MWLDDTQTMRFRCACWHAGQQGAAWQCLTLTRVRTGDQHHEAQLTTELRAGGMCVCVCVFYHNVSLVVLVGLWRFCKSLASTTSGAIMEVLYTIYV